MKFCCDFCNIEVETMLEKIHIECGQIVQTYTIIHTKTSDIDRILHECVINHNKNFEIFNTNVFSKMNIKTWTCIYVMMQ